MHRRAAQSADTGREVGPDDLEFDRDLAMIAAMPVVPTILDTVCRTTGMGFAAIARVIDGRWRLFSVRDQIGLGLQPGAELTTRHNLRSSIAAPIRLPDGDPLRHPLRPRPTP